MSCKTNAEHDNDGRRGCAEVVNREVYTAPAAAIASIRSNDRIAGAAAGAGSRPAGTPSQVRA